MWRVALKRIPGEHLPRWHVVQCWHTRGQETFNLVKVERKNPRRKRLILAAPWPVSRDLPIDPAVILKAMLAEMPDEEKAKLAREGML